MTDTTTNGPVLAADGTPLKRSLARALRMQKMRALMLIAPLLIFVLVTFIAPIADMLFRSVENEIVRETLPKTVVALADWDATSDEAPGEDVFAALAAERGAASNTLDAYERDLAHAAEWLGDRGLDFSDLQMTRGWSAQKAYAASKLATILMTEELERRLADQGVTARAVHPGVVSTNFGRGPEGRWLMRAMMTALGPVLKKPSDGAAPVVLLATASDDIVAQSLYWSQTDPAEPSPAAQDRQAAVDLWEASERLVGLA